MSKILTLKDIFPRLYIICDPCYIIKKEFWDEFCDRIDELRDETLNEMQFYFHGEEITVFHTAYGDGDYYTTDFPNTLSSTHFLVDSGMIAAIPANSSFLMDNINLLDYYLYGPDKESEWTDCQYIPKNGIIRFGKLMIETDPDIDYDEAYEN